MGRITVVDYKMGNIQSIVNALEFLAIDYIVTDDKKKIRSAEKLLLSGVGHFKHGMENLFRSGLDDLIIEMVAAKRTPVLGICLGMQMLSEWSEEGGKIKGLGLLSGKIVRMQPNDEKLQVPHYGWKNLTSVKATSPILKNITKDKFFYFIHSYCYAGNSENISATYDYGGKVVAGIEKNHIFGVQFHPEKSNEPGLNIFKNFGDYNYA